MTDPVAIRVIDSQVRCLQAFHAYRHPTTGWQLEEKSPTVKSPLRAEVEFPLTLNAQDTKGNILKMRVQLGVRN